MFLSRYVMIVLVVLSTTTLLVLGASSAASDATGLSVGTGTAPALVQQQTCATVTWQETQPVIANCTYAYNQTACTDPPTNASCTTTAHTYTYACQAGTTNITKQRQDCTTTGYVLNNETFINTTGYNCSITSDGKAYLTCDSIYDGNGDGICTSGESCLQFGIVGSFVVRKERNTGDQYQVADPSFFLPRATTEAAP
jgi:hypothetical protein